jgi:hypothetical protein
MDFGRQKEDTEKMTKHTIHDPRTLRGHQFRVSFLRISAREHVHVDLCINTSGPEWLIIGTLASRPTSPSPVPLHPGARRLPATILSLFLSRSLSFSVAITGETGWTIIRNSESRTRETLHSSRIFLFSPPIPSPLLSFNFFFFFFFFFFFVNATPS